MKFGSKLNNNEAEKVSVQQLLRILIRRPSLSGVVTVADF